MNAWTILSSKSSLLVGTAWQHLNAINQTGGTVIIGGNLSVDAPLALSANVRQTFQAENCISLSINCVSRRLAEINQKMGIQI